MKTSTSYIRSVVKFMEECRDVIIKLYQDLVVKAEVRK